MIQLKPTFKIRAHSPDPFQEGKGMYEEIPSTQAVMKELGLKDHICHGVGDLNP